MHNPLAGRRRARALRLERVSAQFDRATHLWLEMPGRLPGGVTRLWLSHQFVPLPTARQYAWGAMWRLCFTAVATTSFVVAEPQVSRWETVIDPQSSPLALLAFLSLLLAVLGVLYVAVYVFVSIPLEVLATVILLLDPSSALSPVELVVFALAVRSLVLMTAPARAKCRDWIGRWSAAAGDRCHPLRAAQAAARGEAPFSGMKIRPWPAKPQTSLGKVMGGFIAGYVWLIVAVAVPTAVLGAIASLVERLPGARFDDVYVKVLAACTALAVSLQVVQSALYEPVMRELRRRHLTSSPLWTSFMTRRDLLVEVKWALTVAAVAFTPAAVSSTWLPFVAVTAVVSAVLVPRIRGWREGADTAQHEARSPAP